MILNAYFKSREPTVRPVQRVTDFRPNCGLALASQHCAYHAIGQTSGTDAKDEKLVIIVVEGVDQLSRSKPFWYESGNGAEGGMEYF